MKITAKSLLKIIFISFSFIIALLPTYYLSSSFYFVLVSFIISSIIINKYKMNNDKKTNIISLILSIYYIVAFSYRSILNSDLALSLSIPVNVISFYIVFPILIFISTFINISYLINNREKIINILNKKNRINCKNIKNKAFVLIVLVAIISFIGNIGLNSYADVNGVLGWIAKGEWNHWHTIGYELYMKIFTIPMGLVSVYLFQTILFVLINKYILDILEERTNNNFIILYLVLNLLFFQPYVFIHLAPKDTIFSLSIMGLTASLFDIVTSDKLTNRSIRNLYIFSILTSIFRHSAVISVVISLLIGILLLRENKKIIIVLVKAIVLSVIFFSFITYFIGDFVLNAKKNEYYVKYTVPIYMIGSYMNDGYEFSNDDMIEIEKYLSKDEWVNNYDKYWADTLSRKWNLDDLVYNLENNNLGPRFVIINLKMLINNPIKYIVNLSHLDSILFEISTPVDGYDWAPIDGHSIQYQISEKFSNYNYIHSITRTIENTSGQFVVIKDILWRGGFYQFIYLIYLFIMYLNKNTRRIAVLLPVILVQLLLYISLPAQDTRYVLPMIMIFPLVTSLTFIKKDKKIK